MNPRNQPNARASLFRGIDAREPGRALPSPAPTHKGFLRKGVPLIRALHWRIAPALGFILCLAAIWSLVLSLALIRPHAALAAPMAGPALREAQTEPMRTVLVRPKADLGRMAMRSARAAGLRERHMARRFARLGIEQWSVPQGQDPKAFAAELMATGEFEYAEPNVRRYRRDRIPNDPGYASQWAMYGAAGSMNMEAAWDLTTGSRDVVVAVIDDSVAWSHPDLAANIWTNPNEIPDNGVDDDDNGHVDDVRGWDFADNDADPSPRAGDGHGTNVAGCVGAVGDNEIGVAGAAWQVSIMPLRISYSDSLFVSSTLEAFEYAMDNGAHIINASWGGPEYSPPEAEALDALEQAGILLVAAAGNWNMDNDLVVDYPSGLPNKNIVSVAASNQANGMVPWSHFGATSVDLAAPGVSIYTTANGGTYEYASGTSFSSPYVAGIAALIKSKALADGVDGPDSGDADYLEIKGRLLAGASAMDDAKGRTATGGRVDAYKALTVDPQPVPMIAHIAVDDTGTGNGNGELDPGETAKLQVTLENYWLDAQSLDATLASGDPLLTILDSEASLAGGLASGATAVEPLEFTVWLSDEDEDEAEAPSTLLFDLELAATGPDNRAWLVTRSFPVRLSTLPMNTTIQASLDRANGQAFELFHVDVPEGAEAFSVTVAGYEDVDMLIRKDAPPQFDLNCYYTQSNLSNCFWDDTTYRIGSEDVESYSVPGASLTPGTYYIAVLSPRDPYDYPSAFVYAIRAEEAESATVDLPSRDEPDGGSSSGSGGSSGCSLSPGAGLGLEWLLLAGVAVCLRLRARRG